MFLSSYLFYILIVKDEHPGEVPYECPRYGCDKMFTRKQKQQDHITLHRVRVRCLMFPRYNKMVLMQGSYFRGVQIFCTALFCLGAESKKKTDVRT